MSGQASAPGAAGMWKEAAAMALKAIVGEKVGMTQVWGADNRVVPVTVLRVQPARIVQVKTTERDGYTAVQVTYGQQGCEEAHQARGRPLRQGRRGPRHPPGRAAARLGRRDRGRPGDRRRHPRGRREGRRHRGQPGQGLRRHDEASQLQRARAPATATTSTTVRRARSVRARSPVVCSRA